MSHAVCVDTATHSTDDPAARLLNLLANSASVGLSNLEIGRQLELDPKFVGGFCAALAATGCGPAERPLLRFEVSDLGNTDVEVTKIFDNIRAALSHDPRFPKLTPREFDLVLADVKRDAEEALASYAHVNWSNVADQGSVYDKPRTASQLDLFTTV